MPRQLRRLFVYYYIYFIRICILLHCQPLHPEELWENFKIAMSEDYVRYFGLFEGQKKANQYVQINSMLCAEVKVLLIFHKWNNC